MSMPSNQLTERYIDFIKAQSLFFVATAAADGRVNVSPKGMDTLRILGDDRIVWLNLSGSGNETAAHLAEHDRITLMFCALGGRALIVRVYGTAKVIHPRDLQWNELIDLFPAMAGSRPDHRRSCRERPAILRHGRAALPAGGAARFFRAPAILRENGRTRRQELLDEEEPDQH